MASQERGHPSLFGVPQTREWASNEIAACLDEILREEGWRSSAFADGRIEWVSDRRQMSIPDAAIQVVKLAIRANNG